ncbi:MAG: acyl-CoA/acyl-ACP dehydrogenase, partial [Thermoleophilaceae bacterium]|nr:acyl-CoA/acyl-ACP dehydrogenase [Thermoleophilaceae bacterium]
MTNTQTTQTAALTSPELAELIDVAQHWANDVPAHLNLQLDSGNPVLVAKCWHDICKIGFDRCLAPEAAGGSGLPLHALLAVLQQIATGDGGIAMLTLLANVANAVTAHSGHQGLAPFSRPVYVPASSTGGRDLPVFHSGEVNGEATFALAGQDADGFVIEGISDNEPALIAVERAATGVLVTTIDDQLGLRAATAVELVLDGAPATVVGHADDLHLATITVNLGVAAIASGIAQKARLMAYEYAANRMQGGTAIIHYGAVREMLGAMT